MHSEYSDGRTSVEAMAEGCIARGYSYCAVTDHGYGLAIAHGVSMTDLKRQHAEIDKLNRHYKGRFRILKGIEANILADGALDLKAHELRRLEVVVAAPHSRLRTSDDQTTRMVTAICTRGVHILGHDAGEIVQSVAIAVTMGATKADFDRTIALHPSAAEELVTMRTPRKSAL